MTSRMTRVVSSFPPLSPWWMAGASITAEYRNEVPTPERVLKHIEVIQEEAWNSKGVAKMGYEAAHLFLCYAR